MALLSTTQLIAAFSASGASSQTIGIGYSSFSAFKKAMGPAGPGKTWHHIVEQTPNNLSRF